MNDESLADRLQSLIDQVWKLRPNWQDPERFHEDRSEVLGQLKTLLAEAQAAPNGAAVATRAAATLRRLEAKAQSLPMSESAIPTVDVTIEETAMDDPSKAQSVPALEPAIPTVEMTIEETAMDDPSPTPGEPVISADIQALQSTATSLHELLAGIEKLMLTLQAAIETKPAETPERVPISPPKAPKTLFSRPFLSSDEGRRIAATFWANGMLPREIADCFDYRGKTGPSCVLAAIALFLHAHGGTDDWTLTDTAGSQALVRKALRPAVPEPAPESLPLQPAPDSLPAPTIMVQRPPPPPLSQRPQLTRADLRTAQGQRLAAEMWVDQTPLRIIGQHFGYSEDMAPSQASLAIKAFLENATGHPIEVAGDERKRLAREVLARLSTN